MGLCKKIVITFSIISLLLFVPGIPPYQKFNVINIPKAQLLVGPLTPNDYLDYGERLHEGILYGPESIAVKNDQEIFVGLVTGDIVKIWGKNFENVKVLSHNPLCDEMKHESVCGRPLGMRYLSNDNILVADAYLGIYIFDARTGTKQILVNPAVVIENKSALFINDLDFDKEGNIYWSHSSSISNLTGAVLDVLVGPSGRLMKYDVVTQKNKVLLDNIYFANGVQLSPDESFVLVAECTGRTVYRYWLKGENQGTHEVFVSNLPGSPDNIRARHEGGYYVSLSVVMDATQPDILRATNRYPSIRRAIARFLTGLKMMVDFTDYIYPNSYSKYISFSTFHLETAHTIIGSKTAIVLEIDEDGNIINTLQGQSGKILAVSETQKVGNTLLFGSPFMKFLGKLDINKLEQVKQYPKPTSQSEINDEL